MRAAHELSGPGLAHPGPAQKPGVALAKLHRSLTSHFLPQGLKVWKERFPLPCIPKCGAQVNTMPQKQGIPPSLCKSCHRRRPPGCPPGQQACSLQESGATLQEGPHALLFQHVGQPLTVESPEQKLHGFDCDPGRRWDRVMAWQPCREYPEHLSGASTAPRRVKQRPNSCWA